jgi:adenylate cyclase class 2
MGAGWYRLRPMQAMETEVKIRVQDREAFEQKLPALGFTRVTARTFERNTLYDTPERRLRNSTQILRIRQYGSKWVLTHKSVPGGQSGDGRHKNRVETETEVADGPVLGKVFEALGFGPVFVYEKWRTEWADATGHCVLDETPLGIYAELEGPSAWIDATAKQLGISDSQFITLSYGRIFEGWRDETGLKVENFTFDEIPERFR